MNISIPTRRLASRCFFCRPLAIRPKHPILQQQRAASNDQNNKSSNPVLDAYNEANPENARRAAMVEERKKQELAQRTPGDISPASIFEDQRREQVEERRQARQEDTSDVIEGTVNLAGRERNIERMQYVLDPYPAAREAYMKRKVVQLVRRSGRLTKKEYLKRTEREHQVRSHNMKTSVKKLGMLARQIAGKPIEAAITQMRFSKKKIAIEVMKHLEAARDEATVMRGMGLGSVELAPDAKALNDSDRALTQANTVPSTKGEPAEIRLKDGKRHKVEDRSTIYIDQAWVGRGPYGKLPDYRARGRMYIMRTPWTSLSVVLKEEHTRVREHNEREEKRIKKIVNNVWTQLPDRPVQWQRQWYTF